MDDVSLVRALRARVTALEAQMMACQEQRDDTAEHLTVLDDHYFQLHRDITTLQNAIQTLAPTAARK